MSKVYSDASNVTAEVGAVKVKGPDGVDVEMTPEAAAETSDRLLEAAGDARGLEITEARRQRPSAENLPPAS
ncbi:MAG TPA: hypothetical protein VGB62_08815 [Allosphingosinicella sp.]|jgi:hypothetical protein